MQLIFEGATVLLILPITSVQRLLNFVHFYKKGNDIIIRISIANDDSQATMAQSSKAFDCDMNDPRFEPRPLPFLWLNLGTCISCKQMGKKFMTSACVEKKASQRSPK